MGKAPQSAKTPNLHTTISLFALLNGKYLESQAHTPSGP